MIAILRIRGVEIALIFMDLFPSYAFPFEFVFMSLSGTVKVKDCRR